MRASRAAHDHLIACLQRVAGGDADGLRDVYNLTAPALRSVAYRFLENKDEADDLIHEVFLAVWAHADRFDPKRGSAMTWLITIVRNRALDRLRTHRSRGVHVPLENGMDVADEHPDPFTSAVRRSEDVRLRQGLDALDARTRRFIVTTFFDGLTYNELARHEELPLGTVKTIIRRGLLKLRAGMEEDGDPLS